MNLSEQRIKDYLTTLGLSGDEAKIYLALIKYGNLTILEIARKTDLPRTTIYRKLENLKKRGVVDELIEENTTLIKAADPDKLNLLVKEKETISQILRSSFPDFASQILQLTKKQQPDTKVLFYRGKDGIAQMLWNVLRAKKEMCGYTCLPIETLVNEKFIENWTKEFVSRRLKGRDLYSDSYLKSRKEIPRAKNADWSTWKSRYIPSSLLNIEHQLDIYNDVVSIYNWYEGEVFGVEIYNEKVARLQKQIFEILWKMGKSKKKI